MPRPLKELARSMENEPQTLAQAFLEAVQTWPRNEAIVAADGRRYLYADMLRETSEMVRVLTTLECQAGDRVAIWLPNRPEWAFLQYACALLGLVIVPVNARYRAAEVEHVLSTARAKVLFLQPRFLSNDYLGRLTEIAHGQVGVGNQAQVAALGQLRNIVLLDWTQANGRPPPGTTTLEDVLRASGPAPDEARLAELAGARRGDEILWVFWTSGSTGRPKGAQLTQDAVGNVWHWTHRVAPFHPTDRVLTTLPVFYIAGNYWCLLSALLNGAAVIMAEYLTPEDLVERCGRKRVTVFSGVPFMLKELVHHPAFDPRAFASVRMGFCGGASLPAEDTRTIIERIGYDFLIQVYGMTELQAFCMCTDPDDPLKVVPETCGRPFPGYEMRIVDPASGENVPSGDPGELIVRGRTLRDYEGISAAERAQFFDSEGFYHTDDIMRVRPDGRYVFITRAKDLIKVGGENVAAVEIEAVLKTHPKIFTAQVVGIPDERRGEIPAALVELRPGEALTLAELRAWCRTRMAPFKIPRTLKVVEAGSWPIASASGKVERYKLADML